MQHAMALTCANVQNFAFKCDLNRETSLEGASSRGIVQLILVFSYLASSCTIQDDHSMRVPGSKLKKNLLI